MYPKKCIECAAEFETGNYNQKRCNPNCRKRTLSNKKRTERNAISKKVREEQFKCGLSRSEFSQSDGKCKHCRALSRTVKNLAKWEGVYNARPTKENLKTLNEFRDQKSQLDAMTK